LELDWIVLAILSELEKVMELKQEVTVHVGPEQSVLDKLWKLIEKSFVVVVLKAHAAVSHPSLSKILLNLDHQFWVNWLAMIKPLN
jgi:hypothetical protein